MARLELFLLGPPRLERDGVPLQFDTRKIMALVAYLAVSGLEAESRHISRDSLLALLWPELEPSRARAVLRRNLSLLRSALEGEWLVTDRQNVSTDPEANFWLDVDHFSRLVRAWQTHNHPQEEICPQCLQTLAQAVALYQGDFLEGFGLRDSVAFDDWQFFQAEGLRREMASALEGLVRGHSASGDHEAALPHARRWLALDPLHEPAHHALMRLYAQTGQRSAALRQYEECVRILGQELGLAPAEETTALFEQIRVEPLLTADLAPATDPTGAVQPPHQKATLRHNLPAQITPFVGREEELAELSVRLQDPDCRLLTLLGPGGIGKTRLALRLAKGLVAAEAESLEHGVFFVPLASIQTQEGLVPAVAEALDYTFATDVGGSTRATPNQQLLDFLRRKRLLLVMDNYEHLLADTASQPEPGKDGESGSAGFLTDLLSAAPGVKVLVTSRASLKIQGEHLYPLTGLRVPDATLPVPKDNWQALRGYSAIELFVQGAQRARAGFELRSQDVVHVARICRLVQGMPLGILLAAAWVEILALEEIAAEIQQSLDFLETDLRDVPLRQRSIRAVFDHSWRLLDERERALFQGLSVFLGGFTREEALEVVGASLRDLMSLVSKSLLHTHSPGRYELHELLRQYGAERLSLSPEHQAAVRDKHCTYYSAALERWAGELKGARQREALAEMDLEIENGRAAWYWAVENRRVACLAQGVDGMGLYHTWRFRNEEGEAAFRAAVGGLETVDTLEARRLRAKCLTLWSSFHLGLFRRQPSIEAAERGMALLQELESVGHDVRPEMALAVLHEARLKRYSSPDPLDATKLYRRSVTLYEEVADRWGLARALANLGWMVEQLGQFSEARELCQKSLSIRQELGDRRGAADAMLNLSIVSWVQGRLDEAERLLRESIAIFQEYEDWVRMAHAVKTQGEVLVRRGQFDDGLVLLETSAGIYDDLGYDFGVGSIFLFLAEAKVHQGRYREARLDVQQGQVYAFRSSHIWGTAFSHLMDGLAAMAQGAGQEALVLLQESADAFEEIRHRENRGWALGPLGLAARQAGEAALARQCVAEALQTGVDLGAFMPVMYALPVAALLLADRGATERAVEAHACACRYGFVTNSRWFEEMVGQQIRATTASLPAETVQAARARGQAQDWERMAAKMLAEL